MRALPWSVIAARRRRCARFGSLDLAHDYAVVAEPSRALYPRGSRALRDGPS